MASTASSASVDERMVRRVPAVGHFFWATTILAAGMGEVVSDYLDLTLSHALAAGIGLLGVVVVLAVQLSRSHYAAWAYWSAVAMVAVIATQLVDAAHFLLGVPFGLTAAICAAALAVIFGAWYLHSRTFSLDSISTRRREALWWAVVLVTFAMGTAVGDTAALDLHLGFLVSGLLFTVVFAVPFMARRTIGLPGIVAFWFAYLISRPLAASYADWLALPRSDSGLNAGPGIVGIVLALAVAGLVVYLSVSKSDVGSRGGASTSEPTA
jgi:uncharacterized membrane-anchored protein